MAYVKWIFILIFWLFVGGFLHYTLPQYDVVRIVNTYEERKELGDWTRMFWSTPDTQSSGLSNRDVQFIHAIFMGRNIGFPDLQAVRVDFLDKHRPLQRGVVPRDHGEGV